MRIALIVTFFGLFFNNIFIAQAQKASGFGIGNIDELNMIVSLIDTSAEAEFLIDKELITFASEPNYMMRTIYHGKIKILKKSGLDRGTIKLECIVDGDDRESITNIKGFTHNLENGNIVTTSLSDASIFREKFSERLAYTKIIAPNLKVGSVFEFKYTRITPLNVSVRPNAWSFQGTIPARWSEVDALIPSTFYYKAYFKSYLPFTIDDTRDTIINFDGKSTPAVLCRFAIKNAPAYKKESYAPSSNDCIANVEFELAGYQRRDGTVRYISGSWKDVYRYLNSDDNFGRRLNRINFFNDKGKQFETIKDTLDRIDSIFKYVTKEFKWNGELGLGCRELSKCYDTKLASGPEMNMLLVALLRTSKLNANMAVLSSKGNGNFNIKIPGADRFNFAIAQTKVNGKDIFLDATEKFGKADMLPYHSAVKDIFIMEPDSGRFAKYKPKDKRWSLETINYELNPVNLELKGNCEIVQGGYEAIDTKRSIEENGKNEMLKEIIKDNSDWEIDNLTIEDKGRADATVKINYVFTGTIAHQNSEKIYFNPLHGLRFIKNPFEADRRIYPVDFITPFEQISLIKFVIPEGYEIVDVPVGQNIALPEKAGKFGYFFEVKEKALAIRSHLSLSKNYFDPEEYAQLREFFNIVVENQAKLIVLKKI